MGHGACTRHLPKGTRLLPVRGNCESAPRAGVSRGRFSGRPVEARPGSGAAAAGPRAGCAPWSPAPRPQLPGLGRSDGRVPGASVSIRNVPMTSSIFLFAIRRVWGGVCPEQSPPFRLDCWLSRCRVFRGRVHFGDRPCIGRVACPRSAARPLVLLSSVDSGSCSCPRSPIDPSFFYFADHAFGALFNSSLPN